MALPWSKGEGRCRIGIDSDRPHLGGRAPQRPPDSLRAVLLLRSSPVRVGLDGGAVQQEDLQLLRQDPLPLELVQDLLERSLSRLPPHAHVGGGQLPAFRQCPPLAAVLGDLQDGIEPMMVVPQRTSPRCLRKRRATPAKCSLAIETACHATHSCHPSRQTLRPRSRLDDWRGEKPAPREEAGRAGSCRSDRRCCPCLRTARRRTSTFPRNAPRSLLALLGCLARREKAACSPSACPKSGRLLAFVAP